MILTEKLEGISKNIFKKYKKIIIEHIGNRAGIYALYDEEELYYVGRASDLARRVKQHLEDRHSSLWTHFSVYFTKKEQYVKDIEAVLIAIAWPKGNKVKPKLGKETKIKELIENVKECHKDELKELGLTRKRRTALAKENKNRPDLKNYFEKSRPLAKTYKGKKYRATLLKSGKIKYKNRIYNSPTAAALEVVQKNAPNKRSINGWSFWFVKNDDGDWIKLDQLR